jgi:hypothetical protein
VKLTVTDLYIEDKFCPRDISEEKMCKRLVTILAVFYFLPLRPFSRKFSLVIILFPKICHTTQLFICYSTFQVGEVDSELDILLVDRVTLITYPKKKMISEKWLCTHSQHNRVR